MSDLAMRYMLGLFLFGFCFIHAGFASSTTANASGRPNVIVILADDMGYGDMSNNGHPSIRTPNLDRMAYEGQKWTNFYVPASVCSPSRAGLLTGRLPVRSGMASLKHRVFFPWSKGGLPAEEFTLAELFKSQGYQTAMVGKWHLGHQPAFLPTRHGFDSWFGIPYSNDMDKNKALKKKIKQAKAAQKKASDQASDMASDEASGKAPDNHSPLSFWYQPQSADFNVPLMENENVLKHAPDQTLLTQQYTDKSLAFIRQYQDKPFFLYLAFSMPHVPLFRSPAFEGQSTAGLYGDVIEELDDAVGRILAELTTLNLADNTLVVFTSDNGPWLAFKTLGGSAGLLRDGKSTVFEGGVRVPTLFWSPGLVKPEIIHNMASTLDFMATFAELSGAELPAIPLDSFSLLSVLSGEFDHAAEKNTNEKSKPRREALFFYLGDQLAAVRQGAYKAHFLNHQAGQRGLNKIEPPLLFNLHKDPAEQFNIAASHPDVIKQIKDLREQHLATVVPVVNQLLLR